MVSLCRLVPVSIEEEGFAEQDVGAACKLHDLSRVVTAKEAVDHIDDLLAAGFDQQRASQLSKRKPD